MDITVRLGIPENLRGVQSDINRPEYATVIGGLIYAGNNLILVMRISRELMACLIKLIIGKRFLRKIRGGILMPLDFDVEIQQFANIKVIGIGGGNNAINRMIDAGLKRSRIYRRQHRCPGPLFIRAEKNTGRSKTDQRTGRGC